MAMARVPVDRLTGDESTIDGSKAALRPPHVAPFLGQALRTTSGHLHHG